MKIFEDNSAEITARYLSLTAFQVVADERSYGGISAGRDDKAAYLAEDWLPDRDGIDAASVVSVRAVL